MVDLESHQFTPSFYVTEVEKQEQEWKYTGYPGFTAWMASSPDFLVLRRFGSLNARILLRMQDGIAYLEHELDTIDRSCMDPRNPGRDDSFREDLGSKRDKLLDSLKAKLKEYNEYISTYSLIIAQHTARDEQIEYVKIWLGNHKNAIYKGSGPGDNEQDFISHKGNIISLVPMPKSILQTVLSKVAPFLLWNFLFRPQDRPGLIKEKGVYYTSGTAVNTIVNFFILFIGLGLLIGPMWWLQVVTDPARQLGVITGFIILFTIILSTATIARTFEVLAATAVYAAALMVFFVGASAPATLRR